MTQTGDKHNQIYRLVNKSNAHIDYTTFNYILVNYPYFYQQNNIVMPWPFSKVLLITS